MSNIIPESVESEWYQKTQIKRLCQKQEKPHPSLSGLLVNEVEFKMQPHTHVLLYVREGKHLRIALQLKMSKIESATLGLNLYSKS